MKTVLCIGVAVASTFAWGSRDGAATKTSHQELAQNGMTLLMNQLSTADRANSSLMNALNTMNSYMTDLRYGSVAPDFAASRYFMYQDHFYDPWKGMNFTYETGTELGVLDFINNNAENTARQYAAEALYQWRLGNKQQAVYQLGLAVHYYSDFCHSHHASNAIGGTRELSTKHSALETWQDDRIGNYLISSMPFTTDHLYFQSAVTMPYFADLIRQEAERRARGANASYFRNFSASNQSTWDGVTRENSANVQEALALLYYKFAHEAAKGYSASTASTTFNVRIKTRSGYVWDTYGTDNDIRFGIEFNDGRWSEYLCDKSNYNDHEKGDNDTYSFAVPGVSGTDVRKVWIRKSRSTPQVHDDWYPVEFQLTSSDGKLNRTQSLNTWFNGNWGMWYDWGRNISDKYPTYVTNSPLHPIPGAIEAENYTLAGFSDGTSGNAGGQYRSDNVDLERAAGQGGLNWNIGWLGAGEWTEYLLDVVQTGTYTLTISSSQTANQTVSASINGTSVGSTTVLSTGGWQNYSHTTIPNIAISAGRKTLRITGTTGNVNFDRFYLTPTSATRGSEEVALGETVRPMTKVAPMAILGNSISLSSKGGTLAIMTLSGRIVETRAISEGVQNIDLTGLATGVYLAQFRGSDASLFSQKISIR